MKTLLVIMIIWGPGLGYTVTTEQLSSKSVCRQVKVWVEQQIADLDRSIGKYMQSTCITIDEIRGE